MPDLRERVEKILNEKVRPKLLLHGGNVNVIAIREGITFIKLSGHCSGCPSAKYTVENLIREEVITGVEEVTDVKLYEEVSSEMIAFAKDLMGANQNNLLVGQSGGPTAVINSSLYGVISQGLNSPGVGQVYGMINGIEGFLKKKVMDFSKLQESEVELLKTTPGAYLGSCRYKLPESLEDKVYETIFQNFVEYNVGYFVYIGGNDSMDTVSKLSRYATKIGSSIKFIGVPKTVDNDLVLTDHTPGFGSAAKYVATTVREIGYDAGVYDGKSVTIVEIMGRHAGWLTAASVLARERKGDNPQLIYLPESVFECERFVGELEKSLENCNNIVVCVSEGIKDKDGTFICEYQGSAQVDNFGHKQLNGCGKYLENLVADRLNVKVRSVELNVCQRCSATMISKTDQKEAVMSGKAAVEGVLCGETGKMVTFERSDEKEYSIRCSYQDVNEICNKEKTVPEKWITNQGSDISEEFAEYIRPIIRGNITIPSGSDGMPVYARREKAWH